MKRELIQSELNGAGEIAIPSDFYQKLNLQESSTILLFVKNGQCELVKNEGNDLHFLARLIGLKMNYSTQLEVSLNGQVMNVSGIRKQLKYEKISDFVFEIDQGNRLFLLTQNLSDIKQLVFDLADHVIQLDSYFKDLMVLHENPKYLNWFPSFFHNVIESFFRSVCIQLVNFFDIKSQAGIHEIIDKLEGAKEILNSDDFFKKLVEFKDQLNSFDSVYKNIKKQRNKIWAHLDKKSLGEHSLFNDFPVKFDEIDKMIAFCRKFYRFLYSELLNISSEMELIQTHPLENLFKIFQIHEESERVQHEKWMSNNGLG